MGPRIDVRIVLCITTLQPTTVEEGLDFLDPNKASGDVWSTGRSQRPSGDDREGRSLVALSRGLQMAREGHGQMQRRGSRDFNGFTL
jgi:hypothetical protein